MTHRVFAVPCEICGRVATYAQDTPDDAFEQIGGPTIVVGNYQRMCEGDCTTQYALDLLNAMEMDPDMAEDWGEPVGERQPEQQCDACDAKATIAIDGLLSGEAVTFYACGNHVETFALRQPESKHDSKICLANPIDNAYLHAPGCPKRISFEARKPEPQPEGTQQ